MKNLFFCFFACTLFFSSHLLSAQIQWQTNYQQALEQAKSSNKPVLLFFTGSDWCTWCHRLEDEVLKTPAFANALGDKMIFVTLDYPKRATADAQLKAQNQALQQKYSIQGYPTVIVIDGNEKVLTRTGYEAGGAENYVNSLKNKVSSIK